jgi:hypothetical protein
MKAPQKGWRRQGQENCETFVSNLKHNCYVAQLVTDDDSSVRKILTHFIKKLLAASDHCREWPSTQMEKKPVRLPFSTKSLSFGRQRPSSARLPRFLSRKPPNQLPTDVDVSKVDAERMKRRQLTLRLVSARTTNSNRCSAVPLNTTSTTTNFVELGASATGTEEEVRETGLVSANPTELYLVLKSHHEQFMEDDKLKQLFHTYDTNLVEGFNKF